MEMKPSDCETISDVLSIKRSYFISGRWDMMIQHDGAVILTEHIALPKRSGRKHVASIAIPRRHFLKLIEFYTSEQ